jgi:putative flippase GtrA
LLTSLKQFLRYSGVGLLATLVHYVVLMALVESQTCSAAWGSAWGAAVGAQVAFGGNRWWTFAPAQSAHSPFEHPTHQLKTPLASSWLRFQLTALVAAVLGVFWLKLGMHAGLHYLLAQMLATGINLVLTFAVNRYWTFQTED